MKLLLVIFGLFLVFLKLNAQDEDLSCRIMNENEEVVWNPLGITIEPPINDTHKGQIVNYTTENIKTITVMPISSNIYLNATLEKNILTIFTTEKFEDFEKDRKGLYDPKISIEIKCECANEENKTLIIHQEVIDINNHSPVFDKERYVYNFLMAIPADFELTTFQAIRASDDDYMNNNIDFTTETDEINTVFELQKTGSYNDGYYEPKLKALQNIPPPFKQELIITATDQGNPTLSTTATVIITVDLPENNNNADHPPVFSQHIYFANYTLLNTINMEENIIIKYGAKENMSVRQSGYEEYIKITQNSLVKEQLDMEIIKALTEEILENNYIVIEIEAKNEGSSYQGFATLFINLPSNLNNNNDHPPIFSKTVYYGNYSNHILLMDEEIYIKYGAQENMIVQQSGYEEYFKITQNSAVKEVLNIEITEELTMDILKNNYIIMEIEASNQGSLYKGLTTLLINLPEEENNINSTVHPPVFSKTIYFANYTLNNELEMEEKIIIKYGGTNDTIVKQSGYEEHIKINLNENNKTEIQVQLIQPFNNETLENDLIVIEIIAVNEGLSIPARTNLVLRLQKELNSSCYNTVHVFGFSIGSTVFPLILFLSAITMIVFVNVIILTLYFKKNRAIA